jgi:hypothetical protein
MRTMRFLSATVLTVLFALAISPSAAQAATLTYNMTFVFSGSTPSSSSPYATAQFRDGVSCSPACPAGTVQLVLTSSLESGSEFITEWDFNTSVFPLSITYDAGNLLNSGSYSTTGVIQPVVADAYQADGDGKYDIGFQFLSAQGSRFDGFDVAVFTITGNGITVSTFDLLAAQGGGAGPFKSAAHVQGIPPNCSGWVSNQSGAVGNVTGPCTPTVPEPSSLLLLGSGLAGLAFWGRKKVESR